MSKYKGLEMIIDIANTPKKRIDKAGNPITNPAIVAEIERIENAQQKKEYVSAKEKLRLNKLLKYGDKAEGKNKLAQTAKARPAPQPLNLAKDSEIEAAALDSVIDDLFQGRNPFDSLKKYGIAPRAFYTALKSPKKNKAYYDHIQLTNKDRFNIDDVELDPFSALSQMFLSGREVFAESCLSQLVTLSEQVKTGQIDSSTYSAISYNLRWIMSKLFPAAYSDKIQIESNTMNTKGQELDLEKVKALASML